MSREVIPYLAGPIKDCTDEECIDWREAVKKRFPKALDPMQRDYRGQVARWDDCCAVVEADKDMIRRANVVIANCFKPSAGTSMEILYAWERGIPVVTICPTAEHEAIWYSYHSAAIVRTVAEACGAAEVCVIDGWGGPVVQADAALRLVLSERMRQDRKWGEQNHAPPMWHLILSEEVGELAEAKLHYASTPCSENFFRIREEASHVAAVAISLIECMDRGEWRDRSTNYAGAEERAAQGGES